MTRHGTYAGYISGCRCPDCRAANMTYMRRRRTNERENRCARSAGRVPGIPTGLGWPLRKDMP